MQHLLGRRRFSYLLKGMFGVLLAAVFAIAVIALILYNFFTRRREDEEYLPSSVQSGGTPSAGTMSYAQNYSFGSGPQEEKKMRDRTHDIIESRKKRLATGAEAEEAGAGIAGGTGDSPTDARSTESTATDEDMASILSELEHKAREKGETTQDEEAEVEKTISELEAIREKLRAMRTKGKGAEMEGSEGEAEEPESSDESGASEPEQGEAVGTEAPEEKAEPEAEDASEPEEPEAEEEPVKKAAPKYKPSSRKIVYEKRVEPKVKPVAKGKKMRFGNRGVKKR